MVKLVDDVLAKEQAKALAMRQRFEERTRRFLDTKQRTIGVDKEYLQKQVEEKRLRVEKDKEDGKNEAIQLEQLCKFLEESELAKEEIQQRVIEEVQATLGEQVKHPKNNAIAKCDPLDLDNCGPSSVQRFQGEDNDFDSRKKMQQRQLQQWCEKHLKMKEEELQKEAANKNQYSQYILAEDKLRCEMHEHEQSLRTQQNMDVMIENLRLAEERTARMKAEKETKKRLEIAETNYIASSPLFCEETNFSKSALSDKRVRPDHFKGFSLEKNKAIIDANSEVLVERQHLEELDRQFERNWAAKEAEMIKKMEEIEKEKLLQIKQDNEIQAKTLKIQIEELKAKQDVMKEEKFGAIGLGFFQKFGTSCR